MPRRKGSKKTNEPKAKSVTAKTTKKSKRKKTKRVDQSYVNNIVPYGNIVFYSDYFKTGVYYGAVLTFMAEPGSVDGLPPMWGAKLIPVIDDDPDVTARLTMSYQTRSKDWVDSKSTDATNITGGAISDAEEAGQGIAARKGSARYQDNLEAMDEIARGASYLDVTYRIILYAPSRPQLAHAIRKLSQRYQFEFGSAELTQFVGQQEEDYSNLLAPATEQLGIHDGYTSVELAGSYPFVGKGWIDPNGQYIGQTAGEMNISPVLWDMESIERLAIIAGDSRANILHENGNKELPFTMQATWLTLLSQGELMNGHRVFDLVLNDEDITKIGMDLGNTQSLIDANSGQINVMQVFGDTSRELQLYNVLIRKLKTIIKQLNHNITDNELSLLDQSLEGFFEAKGIWSPNAKDNRDKLRLVGLANNDDYPTINEFMVHLSQNYLAAAHGTGTKKQNSLLAGQYLNLVNVVRTMNSTYGYLFNTKTTFDINVLKQHPRQIFSFKGLQQSGSNVLMAQFINIFSFIVNQIQDGDTIHIYGSELLTPLAWEYVKNQMNYLNEHNNKVALGFNNITAALESPLFKQADTYLFGQMKQAQISEYAKNITGTLPDALINQMTSGRNYIQYLRRHNQNTAFLWDPVVM